MAKHEAQTKKKRSVGRVIAKLLGGILGIVVLAVAGLLTFLTITEYHPAESEELSIEGSAEKQLMTGEEFTLLTWNIGYGALGDNADFFMDGGTMVNTATLQRVEQNMRDIVEEVQRIQPDIALFQEVDKDSTRSHHVNQAEELVAATVQRDHSFAINYLTPFVPIGIPPYGKINGGILSLSAFDVKSATRHSLPLSYTWPMSTVQLKRCELIMRFPVEGSSHELVLINEHPDAYTDEEHHAAQIAAIVKTLEAEAAAGNYVIAGGDWNHSFSNIDISAYPMLDENNWKPGVLNTQDFSEGWQFVMDNTAPTSRLLNTPYIDENGNTKEKSSQFYMIDGFIVSKNVRVLEVKTHNLQFRASDHNPVVMKVLLEKD